MQPDIIKNYLPTVTRIMASWDHAFPAPLRAELTGEELSRAITRLSYVEGYWRIRQTIPLVLAAIRSFDSSNDRDSARFWIQHLDEESGHDSIMFRDIVAMEGTESAARQLLQKNPISAPSVALIAYFERMVNFENPHTLIFLRIFQEWFFSTMDNRKSELVTQLFEGECETLNLHREEDQHHVDSCYDYIARKFSDADLPLAFWTLNFIGYCLRDSQRWVANRVLASSHLC